MASNCKYAEGILINFGFMSVGCAVQISFQEAFWKIFQWCSNMEKRVTSNFHCCPISALLLSCKSWVSISPPFIFPSFWPVHPTNSANLPRLSRLTQNRQTQPGVVSAGPTQKQHCLNMYCPSWGECGERTTGISDFKLCVGKQYTGQTEQKYSCVVV